MSSVIFYKMPNCGWCTKSQQLLQNEINNGRIIVKNYNEAPPNAKFFPYFTYKNKSFSGYPGSKEKLYNHLNYKITENYNTYNNSNNSNKYSPYASLKNYWK